MTDPTEAVGAELDGLIEAARIAHERGGADSALRYRLHAAIRRHAPRGSPLPEEADRVSTHTPTKAHYELMQLASALRADFADGYLRSIEGQIQQEVFDDFLDMASHICRAIHFGPATVLAGCVLEEHARKLAEAEGSIDLLDPKGKP